jgi:uncharacterized SAM-binding protein YcdF (DUF218 family)
VTAPPLIVIFGAAVDPNGEPSAALLRRIAYGRAAADLFPSSPILCSGGAVRPGPTEASIMADRLIAGGVAPDRLRLDPVSLNTRQNVEAATHWRRRGEHAFVVVCSDAYHLPRITMLLGLHGVQARRGPVPAGPGGAPLDHWIYMSLREALAIPFHLAIHVVRGLGFRP